VPRWANGANYQVRNAALSLSFHKTNLLGNKSRDFEIKFLFRITIQFFGSQNHLPRRCVVEKTSQICFDSKVLQFAILPDSIPRLNQRTRCSDVP
jgi:hypothetical protein